MEHDLRGKELSGLEDATIFLESFFSSKDKDFYRRGIHQLPDLWKEVVDKEGGYCDN